MEIVVALVLAFIAVIILNNRQQNPPEEIKLKGLREFGRRETK